MKSLSHLWLLLGVAITTSLSGQVSVVSNYTQDFDSIGTALPDGWAVWTNSSTTSNGTTFAWDTATVANNAGVSSTSYFRNVPGASQTWSAGLSSGSDRALGWRAGNAASRDGSITFTLSNTADWAFNSLSFDLFTPNNAGSAGTFLLEYQIGNAGTFAQLGSVSYTNNTAQNPLVVTSITLNSVQLSVLNNHSNQVTLRLQNTASSGTSWNTLAIDNFSYEASLTAVPEPSTYATILGGAVLAGVVILRRRKRIVA